MAESSILRHRSVPPAMRLDDLHILIALSKHVSLHGAANSLVTQSALSKALARLEAEAGGSLFERSSRGIVIIATGQTMLRHGRQITHAMHELQTEICNERSAEAGWIRLGSDLAPPWLSTQFGVIPDHASAGRVSLASSDGRLHDQCSFKQPAVAYQLGGWGRGSGDRREAGERLSRVEPREHRPG
ncbi:hypothetical protein BN2475_230012 [Paraburkholderia ribeironis]|uniref:HTH lysR-type domain-containing protein n=1 Tax=Paraburkholderia ribeironis TaxID=1247936 RepID=A0A1N7RXH0_9BURK|nr:hypothetical protein BN2475_230012 [Paraburkholderia ribeironis]